MITFRSVCFLALIVAVLANMAGLLVRALTVRTFKAVMVVILALGLLLLVTACNGAPKITRSSVEATHASVSPKPKSASFGDTLTYPNGVAFSISRPEMFEPSQYAAGVTWGQRAIRFTLKVINNSKDMYPTNMVDMSLTYGPDGARAERIMDYPDVTCGFEQQTLPTRASTTVCAFSLPRGEVSLVAQISDFNLGFSSPMFTGKI